jgi:hypothetical protein
MLKNQLQLETTQRKLSELEQLFFNYQNATVENRAVRDLTLRSLKRAINKLKEEIVRYKVTNTSA